MASQKDRMAAILAAADAAQVDIQVSFYQAVNEVRAILFDTAAMEIALSQMDIDAALAATHINDLNDLLFGIGMDKSAYIFTHTVNSIFSIGAATAISNLPPALQKAIAFDNLSERALTFLRNDNVSMISGLTSASREGVRLAIERTLAEGTNPARQASVIRQLIGLTPDQMQAVLNFRSQLETQSQLGFTPAGERRLSAVEQAMVNRHMKNGNLSVSQVDDLVERYFQSMLNKRATDIAHTESLNAINNGQLELWAQGIDQGIFNDQMDRKFWIVTRDDRLRATHAAIPGMNPNGVKIKSYFNTPFGMVMSPGDRLVNLINCRCTLVMGEATQTYTTDGYIM